MKKATKSCKMAERKIVKYVNQGELLIEPNGFVWRLKQRGPKSIRGEKGFIGGKSSVRLCPKRRAEITLNDYLVIRIREGGKRYQTPASRLIWQYFKGDIPVGLQINHKDGDKTNNRLENLELTTPLENTRHAIRTGLRNTKGEAHPMAKLKALDVKAIRKMYKSKIYSWRNLAKMFDVSKTQIGYIIKNKSWRHIV